MILSILSAIPIRPYERDGEAARIIKRYLTSSAPSLIIFNKFGAHLRYEHAYPNGQDAFHPHLTMNEFHEDRLRMVNSYRNAVRWAVDHFLRVLLEGTDLSQSIIIYTSDHGREPAG